MVKRRFQSSVNIAKTRNFPGATTGSDHELVIMTFRLHLRRAKNQGNIRIRFSLEKLKEPKIAEIFRALIGGKFAPFLVLQNQDTEIDALINCFNTAVTETANNILGKHRPAKTPWITDNTLKLCDKRRELKQKKNTTEGAKRYREANQQVKKKGWEKQRKHGLRNNAKVSKKTCRKTTARKPTRLWKNWQTRNKGELLPSRTKQEMSHRRTRYSKEVDRVLFWIVYTHNNRRSQGARCPSTNQQWGLPYPAERSWSRSKITEERQVGRSGQHSIGASTGRRRGHGRYFTHDLQ